MRAETGLDLNSTLEGDVWQFLDDIAVDLVREYWNGTLDDGSPTFTGARFDMFAGGGDRPGAANRFDESDLVAVSMLSVKVPGRAAIELMESQAWLLNQALAQIPLSPALEEGDVVLIDQGSTASALWHLIERIDGIGWVTAGKLLARKRPKLIPVYDNVVKAALQPNSQAFWVPLWNELRSEHPETGISVADRLREIRLHAGGAALDRPLIRVFDVAVWMRNRNESNARLRFRPRLISP
jgi:hypothetical protein